MVQSWCRFPMMGMSNGVSHQSTRLVVWNGLNPVPTMVTLPLVGAAPGQAPIVSTNNSAAKPMTSVIARAMPHAIAGPRPWVVLATGA